MTRDEAYIEYSYGRMSFIRLKVFLKRQNK